MALYQSWITVTLRAGAKSGWKTGGFSENIYKPMDVKTPLECGF